MDNLYELHDGHLENIIENAIPTAYPAEATNKLLEALIWEVRGLRNDLRHLEKRIK